MLSMCPTFEQLGPDTCLRKWPTIETLKSCHTNCKYTLQVENDFWQICDEIFNQCCSVTTFLQLYEQVMMKIHGGNNK